MDQQSGFNPRRPRGAAASIPTPGWCPVCFNPRRPRGRRPRAPPSARLLPRFQSTPPARAWRRGSVPSLHYGLRVSIRAARAGGDHRQQRPAPASLCFNPRRPRGRRRLLLGIRRSIVSIHARRPRGRRQNSSSEVIGAGVRFNPRRPRGRRPDCMYNVASTDGEVSIHAARARPQRAVSRTVLLDVCFNPRRPYGAATIPFPPT